MSFVLTLKERRESRQPLLPTGRPSASHGSVGGYHLTTRWKWSACRQQMHCGRLQGNNITELRWASPHRSQLASMGGIHLPQPPAHNSQSTVYPPTTTWSSVALQLDAQPTQPNPTELMALPVFLAISAIAVRRMSTQH